MADTEHKLTDAIGRPLLPFDVDGQLFHVRQPMPEEYDDGEMLKTLAYQKTLKQDYVQDVAAVPCSDGEKALFERVISDTQARFDALGDVENAALKDQLAAEIARLRNDITDRTLAEEFASDKATLARDRWLTMRLLLDENGKAIFDLAAKDFPEKWAKFPIKVKDAARVFIWHALSLVREAPFSSGH